jgi:hypothetical protein
VGEMEGLVKAAFGGWAAAAPAAPQQQQLDGSSGGGGAAASNVVWLVDRPGAAQVGDRLSIFDPATPFCSPIPSLC